MGWLKALLISVIAVFAPAKGMVLTCLTLVACDFILGVWAAYKEGKVIKSREMRRTAIKLLIFEAAILLGFITETYMLEGMIPVAKIIAAFIGMIELVSCMENLNRISGNDLLRALIDKLGNLNKDPK